MKQLYLKNIGSMDLLVSRCLRERCGELNIHGFYQQLKSAGAVTIDRKRLRAWYHWECKRCGSGHSRMFRLTTGKRRPRLQIPWSRLFWMLPSSLPAPVLRNLCLWTLWAETRLPF